MREPAFWHRPPSWTSSLLTPLGAIYGWVAGQRMQRKGIDPGIPVLCVGNYHVGGAGKTPLVLALIVPVAVARDRGDGVALARSQGASVILMDDGFQNPAIAKHASLIVIDGERGLGNACVFPGG